MAGEQSREAWRSLEQTQVLVLVEYFWDKIYGLISGITRVLTWIQGSKARREAALEMNVMGEDG